MRLALAERLRCPRDHAPTPLIVVAGRVEGRALLRGTAGCPVCRLEARIAEHEVRFAEDEVVLRVIDGGEAADLTDERLTRTRALLGLAEPGGALLVSGRYASLAASLAAACEGSVVATEGRVPFSDQTFRAAALELPSEEAVRAVAIGGRILAPIAAPQPPGLRELARDGEEWLAEREATSPLIPLLAPRTARR